MKYLFLFIVLLFYQCRTAEKYIIKNRTDQPIDSLIVSNGFDKIKFEKILPSQFKTGYLDFEKVPNWDGIYFIYIWSENRQRSRLFGYYTSGIPSYSKCVITVRKDTIEFHEYLR